MFINFQFYLIKLDLSPNSSSFLSFSSYSPDYTRKIYSISSRLLFFVSGIFFNKKTVKNVDIRKNIMKTPPFPNFLERIRKLPTINPLKSLLHISPNAILLALYFYG